MGNGLILLKVGGPKIIESQGCKIIFKVHKFLNAEAELGTGARKGAPNM
jgi:hypothetical protein